MSDVTDLLDAIDRGELHGPSRKVVSREVIQKKWQLVTLECAHRILMPKYRKSAKVGCGFCGGFDPMS